MVSFLQASPKYPSSLLSSPPYLPQDLPIFDFMSFIFVDECKCKVEAEYPTCIASEANSHFVAAITGYPRRDGRSSIFGTEAAFVC